MNSHCNNPAQDAGGAQFSVVLSTLTARHLADVATAVLDELGMLKGMPNYRLLRVCSKLESAFAATLGQCTGLHYPFDENGIEGDSEAMAFVQNYRSVLSPSYASKIAHAIFDRINRKINDIRGEPTANVGADPALVKALETIRGAEDEHDSELIANFVSLVNQRLNLERSQAQRPPAS